MTEFDGKTILVTGGGSGVADTVAFLPSARAAYVNGQDLIVDGGLIGSVPLVPAAF